MFWGWGSWSSGRGWRGGVGCLPWLLFFGFMYMTGMWGNWWLWVLSLFVILPFIIRAFSQWNQSAYPQAQRDTIYPKRKRDEYGDDSDEGAYEKPKREPRYALGDDGELVELPPEELPDELDKPKRRSSSDDEYV